MSRIRWRQGRHNARWIAAYWEAVREGRPLCLFNHVLQLKLF